MDFKIGTIISVALFLDLVQIDAFEHSCTRFRDLADPCGCTLSKGTFEPICGSDGNTYLSPCFLHCQETLDNAIIRIEHKGICTKEAHCACNPEYTPVCATNGVTYTNQCVLNCNNKKDSSIRLKHHGTCEDRNQEETRLRTEIRKCFCNPQDGPLCASDGVTYTNYCVMRCLTKDNPASFAHWGTCEDAVAEHEQLMATEWLNYKPNSPSDNCKCLNGRIKYYARCGNEGQSYARPQCYCQHPHEHMKQQDPCNRDSQKMLQIQGDSSGLCYCAATHRPVCGTNGETFPNTCVLHCKSMKDSSIQFQRWGPCGGKIHLLSRFSEKQSFGDETLLRKPHKRNRFIYL